MAKFTIKHYRQVARIIGRAAGEPKDGSDRIAVLLYLIQQYQIIFSEDNPRFDKELFKEAAWEAYRGGR